MGETIDRDRVAVVRARLAEMSGEIPPSGGGGGKGGHSDRTGSLAFRHRIDSDDPDRGHLADVAGAASKRLDDLERRIVIAAERGRSTRGLVRQLNDLLSDWEPLGEWQTDNLRAQGGEGEAGCVSCRRVGAWSPLRTLTLCRTCEKILARVAGLYVWDEDVPPRALIDMSRRGVKITVREIDRVMLGTARRD